MQTCIHTSTYMHMRIHECTYSYADAYIQKSIHTYMLLCKQTLYEYTRIQHQTHICTCMYMHTRICIWVYIYIYIHVCVHALIHVHIHVCMHTYKLYICTCANINARLYNCIHICAHEYTYLCVYSCMRIDREQRFAYIRRCVCKKKKREYEHSYA